MLDVWQGESVQQALFETARGNSRMGCQMGLLLFIKNLSDTAYVT